MIRRIHEFDLVVAGGGLAGFCAALAAARHGLKACLVQERPVLGGVASSEVRVTVHGAGCHHAYGRETGIIGEILAEERARNHEPINENGWTNAVFDQVLYDLAMREPNLTLHLNTPVTVVLMEGGSEVDVLPHTQKGYYERPACTTSRRIAALVARTQSAEVELELRAPLFVDATGDAFIADRAGCAWRMGSEGKAETGETHAPAEASTATMGNSVQIRAKDIGRDAPFTAPPWAVRYEDPRFFYEQGRIPHDPQGGFWWIEIGVPWHTIHDNETIRHELTRHALGVWDWMKNRDPKMKDRCRTMALDFIGQVPGKRESRRVIGRHWLNGNELERCQRFPDEIAYGGWFVDLHTPGGLLAATSEPAAAEGYRPDTEHMARCYVGPYGIPLRSLMARDVDNLFLAGRCLSTTRAALGTVRVMATTALMGQAVGTAAALMHRRGIALPELAEDAAAGGAAVRELQQALLRDGCFLPGVRATDAADLAKRARVTASSTALFHGQSPDDPNHRHGQGWLWPERAALDRVRGQILFLAGGRIDRLRLCLAAATVAQMPLRLVRLDHIWDYRIGGAGTVAETVLTVPAGSDGWIDWIPGVAVPAGVYRLEAGPAPGVAWRGVSAMRPGHFAQFGMTPTRMRDHHIGLAVRVEPPQRCYEPEQVLSGVTRPHAATNLWCSDPGAGLPAWLELAWDAPQAIGRVELCFAGHRLGEVHAEPAFWRDPQTVRDYAIEVDSGDGVFREVLRSAGNYLTGRTHDLPAGTLAKRLRLVVTATNGDPSAMVYEVRCYPRA